MRENHIVLLGSPGAGKGTLAEQLKNHFGYILLSPGEIYRREAEEKTEFGLKAMEYWANGGLCPDEMTNELIYNEVDIYTKSALIFDGYPRNIEQAKFLDGVFVPRLALDISISDNLAIKRLLNRAKLQNRVDDTKEVIESRLKVYHINNKEIVDYYKQSTRLVEIDGSGTPECTFDIVLNIFKEIERNRKI